MVRISIRPVVYSGVAKFEMTLFSLAGDGEFFVQHFGVWKIDGNVDGFGNPIIIIMSSFSDNVILLQEVILKKNHCSIHFFWKYMPFFNT